jgi:hypothetical protein
MAALASASCCQLAPCTAYTLLTFLLAVVMFPAPQHDSMVPPESGSSESNQGQVELDPLKASTQGLPIINAHSGPEASMLDARDLSKTADMTGPPVLAAISAANDLPSVVKPGHVGEDGVVLEVLEKHQGAPGTPPSRERPAASAGVGGRKLAVMGSDRASSSTDQRASAVQLSDSGGPHPQSPSVCQASFASQEHCVDAGTGAACPASTLLGGSFQQRMHKSAGAEEAYSGACSSSISSGRRASFGQERQPSKQGPTATENGAVAGQDQASCARTSGSHPAVAGVGNVPRLMSRMGSSAMQGPQQHRGRYKAGSAGQVDGVPAALHQAHSSSAMGTGENSVTTQTECEHESDKDDEITRGLRVARAKAGSKTHSSRALSKRASSEVRPEGLYLLASQSNTGGVEGTVAALRRARARLMHMKRDGVSSKVGPCSPPHEAYQHQQPGSNSGKPGLPPVGADGSGGSSCTAEKAAPRRYGTGPASPSGMERTGSAGIYRGASTSFRVLQQYSSSTGGPGSSRARRGSGTVASSQTARLTGSEVLSPAGDEDLEAGEQLGGTARGWGPRRGGSARSFTKVHRSPTGTLMEELGLGAVLVEVPESGAIATGAGDTAAGVAAVAAAMAAAAPARRNTRLEAGPHVRRGVSARRLGAAPSEFGGARSALMRLGAQFAEGGLSQVSGGGVGGGCAELRPHSMHTHV